MRQLAERLCLAQESGASARDVLADSRPQQLERDLPIELRIVRRVHDAHAAGAQLREHDVAPDEHTTPEVTFGAHRG
jgi:hypothetical protein